jgi:hypothetical protein
MAERAVAPTVMQHLDRSVSQYLPTEVDDVKLDTPLFWSTFGKTVRGFVMPFAVLAVSA